MNTTGENNWKVVTHTKSSTVFMTISFLLIIAAIFAPFFVSRSIIQDLFFILAMLILAQAWNLLAGYAGMVSVGQQAFVGMGAYAMFFGVIILGFDPIFSIALGGFAAMLLAIPASIFVFRLQGAYFAIGTWVVAEIVRLLVAQWKILGGGTGTSLPRGTTRQMTGVEFLSENMGFKSSFAADIVAYWLVLALAVATIGVIYALLRSKQGLGLAAIRDNLTAARSVGVDPRRIKTYVFLGVSFITGLTGALIYLQKARISPDAAFSVIDWTAYVIFIVVIGGIGTIEGPIIGVLVFFFLQNTLSDYGTWYLIILGVLGIAVMLFAPRGLWGLFADRTGMEFFPIRRNLKNDTNTNQSMEN